MSKKIWQYRKTRRSDPYGTTAGVWLDLAGLDDMILGSDISGGCVEFRRVKVYQCENCDGEIAVPVKKK